MGGADSSHRVGSSDGGNITPNDDHAGPLEAEPPEWLVTRFRLSKVAVPVSAPNQPRSSRLIDPSCGPTRRRGGNTSPPPGP